MTQKEYRKHSNVARLFQAYPDKPLDGYYPLYVEGAGTPCEPIGEEEPAWNGMGFGGGGDGRINYGLLHVLNSIHRSIARNFPTFKAEVVTALCRNGLRGTDRDTQRPARYSKPVDEIALGAVGMEDIGGLLCNEIGQRNHASRFYQEQVKRLARLVDATQRPKLVEIMIDVFGYSRGASQARVFCQWLSELMPDGRLCGVPTRIRFLGIFDTVASVGLPNRVIPFDMSNGHGGWAQPQWLQIALCVQQCVHYLAMHENRASFPLESVRLSNGVMPPNCKQYGLPGMHSDVGGGYEPKAQGRSPHDDDSDKLSQMPLELMYQAARSALVPLNKRLARDDDYDPFAVHPKLREAYNAFIAAIPSHGTSAQWLLPYLAWRYQVRDVYTTQLSWIERAHPEDVVDLAGANGTLLADIDALDNHREHWLADTQLALSHVPQIGRIMGPTANRVRNLAPGARDLLAHLRAHPTLATPENPEHYSPQAYLFANYVHDSFAGFKPFDTKFALAGCWDFIPGTWESEGYLRYRRLYMGNDTPQTAALPAIKPYEALPLTDEQNAQIQMIQHNMGTGNLRF
jgi:hypothetical protein